jgi:hypothetical protein
LLFLSLFKLSQDTMYAVVLKPTQKRQCIWMDEKERYLKKVCFCIMAQLEVETCTQCYIFQM